MSPLVFLGKCTVRTTFLAFSCELLYIGANRGTIYTTLHLNVDIHGKIEMIFLSFSIVIISLLSIILIVIDEDVTFVG